MEMYDSLHFLHFLDDSETFLSVADKINRIERNPIPMCNSLRHFTFEWSEDLKRYELELVD